MNIIKSFFWKNSNILMSLMKYSLQENKISDYFLVSLNYFDIHLN